MKKPSDRRFRKALRRPAVLAGLFFVFTGILASFAAFSRFSAAEGAEAGIWKIGERLTYRISFENHDSAVYAETYVVSKGKLSGRDAVELSAKLRSLDLVSAAFFLWDEARTTFVSTESGFPLFIKSVTNKGPLPQEVTTDFLDAPANQLDLLSLIYKVRSSGGVGSFDVLEAGRSFNFDFAATGGENVKTGAGEFATIVSTVQSAYLSEMGITGFRVNFSDDERRIPVMVRFTTPQGDFSEVIGKASTTRIRLRRSSW